MAEFLELVKGAPNFNAMERGELVIHAYAMFAACTKANSENAKLRELARRFGEYVSQDRCEGCVMKRRCNNGDVEECWQMAEIRALANELGIEGV